MEVMSRESYYVFGVSGMKGKNERRARCLFILFYICLLVFIFGCKSESGQKSNEEQIGKAPFVIEKAIIEPLPLLEDEFAFESSFGWIDDDTIIYAAKKEEEYYLLSYNLSSKKKETLYQTNKMIAEASVSPNGKYVFLYTSEDDVEAHIHILTLDGNEKYTVSIPAREIAFAWNQFSETVIMINAFYEDWTFNNFILDFEAGSIEEIQLPQPFAQWYSKDEYIYIHWDEQEPQLAAPLLTLNIEANEVNETLQAVTMFESGKEVLFAAQVSQEEARLEYTFILEDQEIKRLSAGVNLGDSGGSIPEYDLQEENDSFFTFLIDEKSSSQLIMYNYVTGEQQIVLDHLASAPISVSPNGKWCLYGYSLENVIEISYL